MAFHNLTPQGTHIPSALKSILGLNPKFCPTPPSTPITTFQTAVSELIRSVRIRNQFGPDSNKSYNRAIYVPNRAFQPKPCDKEIESLLSEIQKQAKEMQPIKRKRKYNLTKYQRRLVKEIKTRNELKIVNTDKNLGPAIMTKQQYEMLCLEHLSQNAYQQVETVNIDAIKKLVKNFHTSFIKNKSIGFGDKKDALIIIAGLDQATLSYFHGLPKIHKSPLAMRPIVSSIGSPTDGLSKWLAYLLQPYAANTRSYIKNSDDAARKIRQIQTHPDTILVALDVHSLYTSIPLNLAINAVKSYIRNHKLYSYICKALEIVLYKNYFTFGNRFYKQNVGIAMGTPVAPQVATLYVAYYEERIIFPAMGNYLQFYGRYLDDVFCVFKQDKSDPSAFDRFIGLLHEIPGLKWSFETSESKAVFLDLEIYRSDKSQTYMTRTYQKSLNLYQYPVFQSAHPPGVHSGMIYGLLQKYHFQNSDRKDFVRLANLLFQRLLVRGFRCKTLKPIFEKALKRLENKTDVTKKKDTESKVFFKIPFDPNGLSRREIRQYFKLDKLTNLLRKRNLGRVVVCFKRPRNLGNILMRSRTTTAISALPSTEMSGVNPNPRDNSPTLVSSTRKRSNSVTSLSTSQRSNKQARYD